MYPKWSRPKSKHFYLMKICVASLAFHENLLKVNLHQMSLVRCKVFLTDSIPYLGYVSTAFPWEDTIDTVETTGVPPHTTLLAEIESLRSIIKVLKCIFEQ